MESKLSYESSITSQIDGTYIQTLFDPIQTHAVYGLRKDTVEKAKEILKENKATRFRTVKNSYGFIILCFKNKSN